MAINRLWVSDGFDVRWGVFFCVEKTNFWPETSIRRNAIIKKKIIIKRLKMISDERVFSIGYPDNESRSSISFHLTLPSLYCLK